VAPLPITRPVIEWRNSVLTGVVEKRTLNVPPIWLSTSMP
jgi:hypothetical protein